MSFHETDLKDDRLRRAFQAMAEGETAPEDWVRDAMTVPRLPSSERQLTVGREPILPVILPYVCGVLVLTGMAIALILQGDLISSLARALIVERDEAAAPSPGVSMPSLFGCLALAAAPLVAYFAAQSVNGFSALKRWFR